MAGQSLFFQGILGGKEHFYKYVRKNIGDGLNTRFWEDLWIGDTPLKLKFARLYSLTFRAGFAVAKVLKDDWVNVRFRRTLYGETLDQCNELKCLCMHVQLSDKKDRCKWILPKSCVFTVKPHYNALKINQSNCEFKILWLLKFRSKLKFSFGYCVKEYSD